jgi:CBS domain-containing protein
MTKRVVSISPDASILVAADLMLKHHISGLPVIDNHAKLVGIITEGDFLRRAEIDTEPKRSSWLDALRGTSDATAEYVHSHGLSVKDVMTANPITVKEGTPLDEAVHLMENRNIKRLPVLRDGNIVGILSRANLVRALVSIHRKAPESLENDAVIRDCLVADVAKRSWSSGAVVDAVVHDGIVDLWGTVAEPSQREALVVLAKNVPGVVLVEDHLTAAPQSTLPAKVEKA